MSNPRRTLARVFRWMARGNGVLLLALIFAGCMNHYVLHPRYPPENAKTWREEIVDGDLQMRLEWVRPAGPAPLPVVIVHPEAGHPAEEMRGVLHDLANAGYLAVAADYRRRNRGRWRESLIPWRDSADPGRVINRVRAHPDADPQRIGLLGFSQGGVFSLLIAAYDRRAAAVVAYYPVTDFETWLSAPGAGRGRRMVFRFIRAGFRRASGAGSDAELDALLRHASPVRQVETLEAPVLLVHGDRDRSAGVEESRRLAQRLREMGRPVELLVIPDAGHVFNFRDRRQARIAWDATLAFLDRHVRSQPHRLDTAKD